MHHIPVNHSTQAITVVDLQGNRIDDEGVKHLANALQYNRVKRIPYLFIVCLISSLNIDD
jgi:hypothetical protein